MQTTRKTILHHLKTNGQATVDELALVLKLTTVTVRHHLDILRGEGFVSDPVIRHRSSPGRPQYAYALTSKASEEFPKNYCDLAALVLEEFKARTPPQGVNVFFEGVAQRMAALAPPTLPGAGLAERFERAAAYLNSQGYVAHWEQGDAGFYLHTCNCPYEALARDNQELCGMDLSLVSNLLGEVPQRVSRVVEGAATCAYFIPEQTKDDPAGISGAGRRKTKEETAGI
jgi:predicted ArsR family transcriptional regulator